MYKLVIANIFEHIGSSGHALTCIRTPTGLNLGRGTELLWLGFLVILLSLACKSRGSISKQVMNRSPPYLSISLFILIKLSDAIKFEVFTASLNKLETNKYSKIFTSLINIYSLCNQQKPKHKLTQKKITGSKLNASVRKNSFVRMSRCQTWNLTK
jgi:hypothetical protein